MARLQNNRFANDRTEGSIMRVRMALYSLTALVAMVLGLVYLASLRPDWVPELKLPHGSDEFDEVEITEYRPPPPTADAELVDDQLSEKKPAFIAELIDSRPEGDWRINASSAVLRLDVPLLRPDADAPLLELRPSYTAAMAKAPAGVRVLPSINLIDGKAKQFDDGLYAAIDLAYYKGLPPKLMGHVALIKRIHARSAPDSPASAFLAAALKIAGEEVTTGRPEKTAAWLEEFDADAKYSKPFSFYTWSNDLERVFRFTRFLQRALPTDQPALISDLARAVGSEPKLLNDYRQVNGFYAKLTNPLEDRTLADESVQEGKYEGPHAIAVFPGSRSKETELFRRLFPLGLPPSADLMQELIRAIRSGKVDLAPKADSGWYDHQIYALETFLLPGKGAEHAKLLLTKAYKKRMLEAFQALMTKRRETHARNLKTAEGMTAPPPLVNVKPRLRVEPCPTYYLRTARSYDFLLNFLLAAVGESGLTALHGLKEGGKRSEGLLVELRSMRELFYGFHLLSAEDIGMAPEIRPDEPVDRVACEAKATAWLGSYATDADLSVDTRVSVPLYFDIVRGRTRLWATVGVRLAKLDASYARPPKVKPKDGAGEWEELKPHQLEAAEYLIAVDEFAEVEVPGLEPLTRKELRDACNAHRTRPELLKALSRRTP
jgi:hypothetical protein